MHQHTSARPGWLHANENELFIPAFVGSDTGEKSPEQSLDILGGNFRVHLKLRSCVRVRVHVFVGGQVSEPARQHTPT